MTWLLYPLLGLLLGGAALAALCWYCPKCPRCGSRLKANFPTDDQGRFHHAAICRRCGHVWDWQQE